MMTAHNTGHARVRQGPRSVSSGGIHR